MELKQLKPCPLCNSRMTPEKHADCQERYEDLLNKACMVPKLVDTLRRLHDYQNGPPLPKYERHWRQAMEDAIGLLKLLEEPGE